LLGKHVSSIVQTAYLIAWRQYLQRAFFVRCHIGTHIIHAQGHHFKVSLVPKFAILVFAPLVRCITFVQFLSDKIAEPLDQLADPFFERLTHCFDLVVSALVFAKRLWTFEESSLLGMYH